MAKATIAFSKARGKVGGLVFRHDAGIGTVVSEYNPHPSNPRTLAQTNQRAKMNLAGQLSKVTPYLAIAGMNNNRRKGRSEFVSMLLKRVVESSTPNTFRIEMSDIVISKGVAYPSSATVTPNAANERIDVTIENGVPTGQLLGNMVVCYWKDQNDNTICDVKVLDDSTTTTSFVIPQNVMMAAAQIPYAVYLVPMVDTGVDARTAYGKLLQEQAQFTAAVVRTLATTNAYAASVFCDAGIMPTA